MLVIEQRKAQLSNQVHYVVSLHDCYLEEKSHSTELAANILAEVIL